MKQHLLDCGERSFSFVVYNRIAWIRSSLVGYKLQQDSIQVGTWSWTLELYTSRSIQDIINETHTVVFIVSCAEVLNLNSPLHGDLTFLVLTDFLWFEVNTACRLLHSGFVKSRLNILQILKVLPFFIHLYGWNNRVWSNREKGLR